VREGDVLEKIEEVLREKEASLLVLGASRSQASRSVFDEGRQVQFARQIENDTGVEVRIIALDES